VQRGKDEDERERVRGRYQEPDDTEREECSAVAGEPLLGLNRPPRQEATARDEPTGSREQGQRDERSRRPGDGRQGRRVLTTTAPEADPPEDEENRSDPGPEAEPAAIAAEGGRDPDPASATAGEQVDGGCEEG